MKRDRGVVEITKKKASREQVFGPFLRTARKGRGMTQLQLAEAAGTFESHICAMESGKKRCGPDVARRLAEALYPENHTKQAGVILKAGMDDHIVYIPSAMTGLTEQLLLGVLADLDRRGIPLKDIIDVTPDPADQGFAVVIQLSDGSRKLLSLELEDL